MLAEPIEVTMVVINALDYLHHIVVSLDVTELLARALQEATESGGDLTCGTESLCFSCLLC